MLGGVEFNKKKSVSNFFCSIIFEFVFYFLYSIPGHGQIFLFTRKSINFMIFFFISILANLLFLTAILIFNFIKTQNTWVNECIIVKLYVFVRKMFWGKKKTCEKEKDIWFFISSLFKLNMAFLLCSFVCN